MHQHTKVVVGLLVIVGGAACVLAPWFLLSALDTAERLHRAAEALRATDPRATLMGRLQGALATLWWLGPFRPGPVRDPLEECGVRLGASQQWWEAVWKYAENRRQLACLRESVALSEEEQLQFASRLKGLLLMCVATAVLLIVACWLYAAVKSRVVSGDAATAPVVLPAPPQANDGTGASAGILVRQSENDCPSRQEASAWPPLQVPLSPRVSFTVTLEDWAVPAWFTPEHRRLLHVVVLREGRGWRERFLSGKMDAAGMEGRLRARVQTFLTRWRGGRLACGDPPVDTLG